ncbi:MAG: hypothetical protein RIR79_364 [Pseudomonadota bacterium]|jgi:hypothetical protein
MNNTQQNTKLQQEEASRYADLLDWGTRLGVIALIASFLAYITGVLPSHVPLDQLPSVWNLPVKTYLERTATPTGWGWIALAHKGDLSGLVGIAILSGCSLLPLLGLAGLYAKRRDFVYAGISVAVALVLILAASGIISGGH